MDVELWATLTKVLGPTSALLVVAVVVLWRQLNKAHDDRETLRTAKDAEITRLRDDQDERERAQLERVLPLVTQTTGLLGEVRALMAEVREAVKQGLNARDLAALRRILRERS